MKPEHRNTLLAVAGSLALLAAAFLAGRYTAPVETVTQTDTVTATQTLRVVHVQRVVDTKWRRVIVTKPDGSSISTEAAETHEDTRTAEVAQNRENQTSRTKSESTQKRPMRQISALIGAGVVKRENNWSVVGPTYGVLIEHRLLGPTWGTVLIQSNGTVSVGVGLEF